MMGFAEPQPIEVGRFAVGSLPRALREMFPCRRHGGNARRAGIGLSPAGCFRDTVVPDCNNDPK